jgi:DNA excision repair protein ERCC-2
MEKLVDIQNREDYFFCIAPKKRKTGEVTYHLEIVALDPRRISKPVFSQCYATCSCSGTLNPEIYSQILGLNELSRNTVAFEVPSPFPKNNIKAILVDQINTKFQNRNNVTYNKINDLISEVVFNIPKNIGIFCASYGIQRSLLENGLSDIIRFSGKELFIEDSANSASDNAILVNNFKNASNRRGAVLLGVAGGRNSEGEDFPGDHMNAVIVVGFPFHRPTPRTEAKIKYYDNVFGPRTGWNYAYLGPAIKRANQASGRPIRKLEDKGVIILLDNRFNKYRSLLSKWIVDNMITLSNEPKKIADEIREFYN